MNSITAAISSALCSAVSGNRIPPKHRDTRFIKQISTRQRRHKKGGLWGRGWVPYQEGWSTWAPQSSQ